MNIVKLFSLSALVLSISACSHSNPPLMSQLTKNEQSQLETVHRFSTTSNQVAFVVKSHGCTLPEHFELKQSLSDKGKLQLALLRLKQDRCRAMPRAFPVHFKLKYDAVKKQDIELLNEIKSEPNLPRKALKNNNRS